jgi:hypothetical protein
MKGKVKCTCGWSWNKSDSSKKDMYICHECGRDNSNNMKNGGWLDSYADGGTMQEHQENYNDSYAYAPEGMIGDGFSNVGRNYSPAWGGSFQEGGKIPNAQSGRATRADSLAVFNNTRAIDDYYRKQGYIKEKVKDSKDYKERIKNRKEWVNSSQKYLKEAKNVPVDIFYTQTDKNKNIAEQKKYLKEAQKRLSETIDENNPKNYIKKLEDSKKIFETKAKDIGRYVDEQNNLVEGKPSVEKFYSPIDENKFYQREQSQGFLDLRSPMPLYDKRITPQDLSRFKSPHSVLGEQLLDKITKSKNKKEREALEKQMDALVYSDNVEMYEYDPLAVMPFDMVPLEQQEERIRKYGSSGVPTSIIQQHPDWVNSNTKPISNPTKRNVEGLQPMSVGLQNVDNEFETNLNIPTPVQRKPKYYNITDVNNQNFGGGATSYRVDSLDELRELPKELWNRKITPQYQMGGNIYPVNYVPQAAMGASMPGSVGFTYARTKGIPSEGPYAKKTLPSAQNGKKQFKLKDERLEAIRPSESTSVKRKDFDLEQAKENKTYINAVAAQKKEAARRKKLTQDQREREDYNAYNQERGSIEKYVPESTWDRTKAIVSNPLTAFGYAARNQSLPKNFQYGERNVLDNAIDWINPLQGAASLSEIPGELGRGEFLNAGLSALDAADLGVYAKGAKQLRNINPEGKIFNGLNKQLDEIAIKNTERYMAKRTPSNTPLSKEMNPQLLDNFDPGEYTPFQEDDYMKWFNAQKDKLNPRPVKQDPRSILRRKSIIDINDMKEGGIIKDDMGQWKYPGQITEIGSNQITMEDVPYDVLGISDTGDTKLMKPGKDYKFKGKKVTEFPMAKNGRRQEQKGLVNLDNLLNFTNYNKPQPGGWLNKYN